MPLNITVHSVPTARYGSQPVVAGGDVLVPQVVALAAQSTAIQGPCRICMTADEGQRIAITRAAGYVAPSAAGVKLVTNVERWYDLPGGQPWYVNCVAG